MRIPPETRSGSTARPRSGREIGFVGGASSIRHTTLAAVAVLASALAVGGCTDKHKPIKGPYKDKFDRKVLGEDYHNTGGPYRIVDGKLHVQGAYNKPLWLERRLPRDAVIELDVTSKSKDGDIKVEAWGDGESFAKHKGAYLASSYVFILGGWGNSISALARLDEHGKDRKERRDFKVEPGRTYHWRIERKGNKLSWKIDGKPFLEMNDSAPLEGKHHAYFGFNNWASDLYFDNLQIKPL